MKPGIFGIAVFAVILGGAFLASGPIDERDLFWHIASGRFILTDHRLPEPDPFTYTAGTRKDVHHEWLSQVGLALCEHWFSLKGLRVLRAILTALTLAAGYLAFRRRAGRSALVPMALSIWLVLLAPNDTIRPHLFGWLMAVLVLGILLDRPRPWNRKSWAGCVFLLVLWANLHSSVMKATTTAIAIAAGNTNQPAVPRTSQRFVTRPPPSKIPAIRIAIAG